MRVNVVPSEGNGWIIGRTCAELASVNGWTVGPLDPGADCNFFVDYLAARHYSAAIDSRRWVSAAFFTHPENGLFFQVARRMDVKLCMARQYADAIRGDHVPLGVDTSFYPSLRLGVVGRSYSSGRKGEKLLREVAAIPYVEIIRPSPPRRGADWMIELREFYAGCDALLVPSLVEGGPIPAAEATACGVPVVAPRELGNMDDLPVIPYRAGNMSDLSDVLESMFAAKLERASYVRGWTWENWANAVRQRIREVVVARQTRT